MNILSEYSLQELRRGEAHSCLRCGHCCKNQVTIFTRNEWDNIAQRLGTDRTTLALRERAIPFPTVKPTEYRLLTSPQCPFLVDGLCGVYDIRPQTCRDYPFGKAIRYAENGETCTVDSRCPVVAKWMRLINYEKNNGEK